jgi:hypothetical protein
VSAQWQLAASLEATRLHCFFFFSGRRPARLHTPRAIGLLLHRGCPCYADAIQSVTISSLLPTKCVRMGDFFYQFKKKKKEAVKS